LPCPHCKITIIKRSNNESAVSAAAYQSGEKLFSEYAQEQKYYPYKNEVTHKEIMLPPHVPPEFADRNTLWNSAEAQEKQWNSQLARRFVLAIPREIPPGQYADLIRDYCREFFVSKGMIADFAIHDKGDGNPHAHILLTMRAMDEKGKWLPKSRKVYDLDKNGERIRLASGRWKSHKENTVDWNNRKYAEIWRQGWADTANRYLEANDRPERLDLRSYARQGIDQIPTVHMGAAACQMEKKGIQTNIGNLNRDIKTANRLMQSIRQMVRSLKGWLSDLKEKKAVLLEALEQAKEPTLPELLFRYLEQRSGERADWTSRGKLKGTVADYNKVQAAMDFLRKKGISTVESLDTRLDEIGQTAVSVMGSMKKSEKRIKAINTMLSYIDKYEAAKPVHAEYAAIGWKKKKEKFAESHREELDAYNAAIRYLKANLKGNSYSRKDLEAEREQLAAALPGQKKELEAVQADVKVLRDVRHWLNQVLPSEQYRQTAEPGKKPSVQESLKGRQERIRQEQQTPVFDKLPPEQQQALSDTVQDTLQMLVDADKRIYGDVTGKTLEAIAAQGYSYKDGQLEKQQPEATPDSLLTGETVRTPRGNFHITDMSREQIEAAGFGFHHASEDGKYLIMGNGTQAYAIAAEQPQRDNPLKHVEDTIEQNDNNFDGLINNTPQTPTVADFEQRAKAGEAISVTDLAKAVKAEKREQPQKKPSILKKLDEYKKQAAQQPKDKQKEHKKDLEV